MKKQITTVVATLSLFVALAAIGIAGLGTTVTANIPFDFSVSGKTLPAGKYIVMRGGSQGTLIIRNVETKKAAAAITQDADTKMNGQANLEFRRYGNQYFLAKVSDGNGASELPVTKAERNITRGKDHLAVNDSKPETVIVNATVGQ